MNNFDLLVVNGLVTTASDAAEYDIATKDEKIALLAPRGVLGKESAHRVIDAEGGYVMEWLAFLVRVLQTNNSGVRWHRLPCSS